MPQREFLGWKRPLLELAADWLWQRRNELPHLLVVVPTAQSGRLLREALAERGACLAPRVVTPDSFFKVGPAPGIATPLEERFAWIDALRRLGDEEMPALFPVDPIERTFNWAAGVSDQLLATWDTLAEGSRNFEDARRESPEPERWQDIARLHRRAVKLLARWGKQSRPDAKLLAAQRPALPSGSHELVIIGVPEPAPLAILAWDKLAENGTPIRALVHAPEERSQDFDSWGRPLAEIWTREPVTIAREHIHLVAGAPELSKQVVALCSGRRSDEVTVSLCDPAFGPAVEAAFSEAGWQAWNPEGKAAGRALANLLRGLAALGRKVPPTWQQITSILRNPLLAAILGPQGFFSALERLDQLEKDHLPESLERLQWLLRGSSQGLSGVRRLSEIIGWIDGWRSRFATLPAAAVIQQWVAEMHHRSVDDGADGGLYQLLEAAAPDLALLEKDSRLDDPGDAVELALTGSESLRSIRGREEAVIDLPGWLELSFEKAPTLILAGMHDGAVPDGRMDDAFLPDGVRVRLELRSATTRHARDAFLLRSFAESREVQVVVAKVDPQGEPRRPSRLLLAASGVDLAQRVQQLAGKPPASANRLSAWSRGEWKLDFSDPVRGYLDGDRKLSPSAFRDYLHCPFRFYLRRLLKWDRYEADKMEMSPRDFGTICHFAFEAMGRDAAMSETTDQKELAEFLIATLNQALKERYDTPLSLPLMVQREAATARLERFAEIEVADRMDGWRIVDVEVSVGSDERPWSFEGQPVSMQIDRIDIHPALGMRVLDYKSSAKADSPEAAHLRPLSERRRTFGPTLISASGRSREKVWKNVQLPLYAAYVKERYALSHAPAVGYVNLPATVNDIGISMWHDFDNATMDSALEWTRGAIAGMKAGLHWPPVELTGAEARMDDFADLAPDGFESAVSGSLIEQFKAAAEAYGLERSAP